MTSTPNYPIPSQADLASQYVGKRLQDLPTPAVILDRAKLKKNSDAMLHVCQKLDVGFRAHIKSHKTLEMSKMQVGDSGPAHFIVSTVVEAEHLAGYVKECQEQGRDASILYGVPVPQSAISRLVELAKQLAPGSVSIIIDNLTAFQKFHAALPASVSIGVFIKIDTGYHRAGIETLSPDFPSLVAAVANESSSEGAYFKGFYSHYGHSYAGSSEDDAAKGLIAEFTGLETALKAVPGGFQGKEKLVLSVGATPTATAAQNMLSSSSPRVKQFHDILTRLKTQAKVELHAGVYPLLDCQQIATHARPSNAPSQPGFQPLSKDAIAIKMLLEVTSVYNERAKPEALVAAGSLALGRDPCKSYPGWGIVTPDLGNASATSIYDESGDSTGWIVGSISQEHGILRWEGDKQKCNELEIGSKVMVWPNHACVVGAGTGWYLIVDSGEEDKEVVRDVWVRWRGW